MRPVPQQTSLNEQGATHFVEVERDVGKNLEQRQAKWRNFYQASGGTMFVVCDNRSCMRNIRSEINYCLRNRPLVVSLTNLADLQTGKRGEGDSIWHAARKRMNFSGIRFPTSFTAWQVAELVKCHLT